MHVFYCIRCAAAMQSVFVLDQKAVFVAVSCHFTAFQIY